MTDQLKKSTTLFGAVIIGLGSILGTGAYVSVGLSAQLAESCLLVAIIIAGFTAIFNGLSSAQLASAHPVSGGTYEYGYQFLSPRVGRLAGWLFVVAKSASAATGALAVGWYCGHVLALPEWSSVLIAVLVASSATLLVSRGVTRTNVANLILVTVSISGLIAFSGYGYLYEPKQPVADEVLNQNTPSLYALLQATALMFVAYTGYGRIATMGEEVQHPRYTIPRAVVITLVLSGLLYCAIGASILMLSEKGMSQSLNAVHLFDMVTNNVLRQCIAIAAMCAMAGVVLNLVLGVSRVVFAMGRRGDLPKKLAVLNANQTSPVAATWVTGGVIVFILLVSNIILAWSISAFTVLLYYALTNLAALRVPAQQRFIPKIVSLCGLLSCCLLAVFVSTHVLFFGTVGVVVFLFVDRVLNSQSR